MGDIKQGLATADNNRFLRQWFEVNNLDINFSCGSCDESKNSDLFASNLLNVCVTFYLDL